MENFSIGLSGYNAAQKALEVIGNNIANSATEGYHRQEVSFSPAYSSQYGNITIGGGVNIAGVRRLVDNLLEQELLRQQSSLEELDRKLSTMSIVESMFGEITTDSGLNSAIDDFFNALDEVSAHPDDAIWQNNLVSSAQSMTAKFNSLGDYLTEIENQLRMETESAVEQANMLITQIAELNDKISSMTISGGDANNLSDRRDQYISELSELIGVQTRYGDNGVVDVVVSGVPVVINSTAMHLSVGLNSEGQLGISAEGAYNYNTNIHGGSIGGMLSLTNDFIANVSSDLDSLASAIAATVNNYHVQGVGSSGSFEELTGVFMTTENLSEMGSLVSDGSIFVRVTNTSTGEVTRHEIVVDADNDTLSDVAASISSITGLNASFTDSKLRINADTDYKFDFIPAVLPEPTSSSLTGSVPDISASGIYTGSSNDTYTFTVSGTGSVGNGTLQLIVTNSDGETVNTLDVGSGYAAGDTIDVAEGIQISLGVGDLNDSESFEIDVFADTDSSGVLAAAGINTFFTGGTSTGISVSDAIINDPSMVAVSVGPDMTDNYNALRMAGIEDQEISSLGDVTPGDFYKAIVTGIGQDISVTQTQYESAETMVQNLVLQQGEVSGVDLNEEAAQIIVFEQMIQATAQYLNAVQDSLNTIMDIL